MELDGSHLFTVLCTVSYTHLIYGIAKDQNGKEYFMVKNSWGKSGKYDGIWYASKAFVAYKTCLLYTSPIQLKYRSFKARSANSFIFYPYLLKEYRNRWFVYLSLIHIYFNLRQWL